MNVRSLLLLLARIGLGAVFVAHGWQKFFLNGIDATQAGFQKMGAPLPNVSAIVAATIELAGGVALIVGVATPVFALVLFADMLGAYLIAHVGKGLFVAQGGAELVIVLGAAMLLLVATGAGRFSIDALFGERAPWNRGSFAVPARQ
jgi:putative oxidoreductase